MADNSDDQTTKLPPLNNWAAQTFAYGFLLDRSATIDYSGNAAPNQSGKTGFDSPQPDDIHLLNLNPKSLSFDEPLATDVAFSQGGGKFVESRGGIIKSCTIRGTTGFLPPVAPYAAHMQTVALNASSQEENLGIVFRSKERQTGFFEFYRLRRLFRQFMLERRQGKNIQMHYLDFKADEFWLIEPKRFHLDRGRFTFDYDIIFDCLEPSQKRIKALQQGLDANGQGAAGRDRGADALKLLRNPVSATLDSVTSRAISRVVQLAGSAKQFVQQFNTGVLTLKLQSVISSVTKLQSFFADVAAIRRSALDVPITLLRQLYSAIRGLEDAYATVTPEAFQADVNEWMIEMRSLAEGLITHNLATYGATPGQGLSDENKKYTQPRATQGTKNNFFQETSSSAGSPAVNPFIGTSGLNLVGDLEQMIATTALRAEDVLTGENIFDVAQRLLGDARRFIELVVLNRIQSPFIVSTPGNKPPATIAWGEKIFVPATQDALSLSTASPVYSPISALNDVVTTLAADASTIISNTDSAQNPWRTDMWIGFTIEITSGSLAGQKRLIVENTTDTLIINRPFATAPIVGVSFKLSLEVFAPRPISNPDTVAFGRDMMAVFRDGKIDVVLGPKKQTQTVEGLENLEQAVMLCLSTRRGGNKAHPEYGASSVVGRPFEPNTVAMNIFYLRQSLLADPRISSTEQPRVVFEGTKLFFEFNVRPVRTQKTLFFRVPL